MKQVRVEEIQAQLEAHFILYEVWQLPNFYWVFLITVSFENREEK